MQVLQLLATGVPNQQIADGLVVTLDTVKKHITHLLGRHCSASSARPTAPMPSPAPANSG
jgi:LuxR family maltose regulon positive regulatory protein